MVRRPLALLLLPALALLIIFPFIIVACTHRAHKEVHILLGDVHQDSPARVAVPLHLRQSDGLLSGSTERNLALFLRGHGRLSKGQRPSNAPPGQWSAAR